MYLDLGRNWFIASLCTRSVHVCVYCMLRLLDPSVFLVRRSPFAAPVCVDGLSAGQVVGRGAARASAAMEPVDAMPRLQRTADGLVS